MAKPQKDYAGPRIAARLTTKLDKTLLAYANAATAAGVGILTLTFPAQAKIVYTHAHQELPLNKTFFLDLNHDGIADFGFNNSKGTSSFGGGWGVLTIFPAKSANKIWGDKTSNGFLRYASALVAGIKVGSDKQFTPGNKVMARSSSNGGRPGRPSSYNCKGPWKNLTDRYLGLKFVVQGRTHYGWARLNVTCLNNETVTATLTGYAYETIANKAIVTGETMEPETDDTLDQSRPLSLITPTPKPATLGLLATGSPGLSIWRREE